MTKEDRKLYEILCWEYRNIYRKETQLHEEMLHSDSTRLSRQTEKVNQHRKELEIKIKALGAKLYLADPLPSGFHILACF
jgi:hypothetical protein